MKQIPDALAPLAAYRQFIAYQLVPDESRPGKTHKYVIDPKGGFKRDAHDPAAWMSADDACAAVSGMGAGFGVGFVFTEHDPFFFFDLDDCLQGDGHWSPTALEMCGRFQGAAIEVSQSGRGLHIIGCGDAGPTEDRRKKSKVLPFDLYTEGRFVALTGTSIVGNAGTRHDAALADVVRLYLQKDVEVGGTGGWADEPRADWRGPTDDADLIRRALRSSSASSVFSGKASFADLWECNVEALARSYPPDGNGVLPYDASSADRALAQHLAFWTGNNHARILELMRQSALVRDKWEREDYLVRTIESACAAQRDVLVDKAPEPLAGVTAPAAEGPKPMPTVVSGSTFLAIPDQMKLFEGCVYVADRHAALVPGGKLLKPEQFRVTFGGFSFPMDPANERCVRNAWEAFTESQAFRAPRADTMCFRPDLPPAAIIETDGLRRVNTWWPVDVGRKQGDAGPFLRHLEKLLPDERDRTIILSYMAAVVQHKGVKFQWCPLLQGAEGNGKTMLTRCVAYAVGRRYTHMPPAHEITEKFNEWLFDKVFIGVEDIFVPESRQEVLEILKPMITGEFLAMRAMQQSQVMRECCANFLLNSNHEDAIKAVDPRRLAVIYTAQQNAADVIAAGMGGDYFPDLYDWLKAEGYAIVAELLHTYQIPDEFNPATHCHRAPRTSGAARFRQVSMGKIEQEVQEAVEQGLSGFRGGWVSSMALDDLLQRVRSSGLSRQRRQKLMEGLGYILHPGLPGGRVEQVTAPDGGRPQLFIRRDSPDGLLAGPDAAAAYTKAQL